MFIFRLITGLFKKRKKPLTKKEKVREKTRQMQLILEAVRLHKEEQRQHFIARGGYKQHRKGERHNTFFWRDKINLNENRKYTKSPGQKIKEILFIHGELSRKEFMVRGGYKHMRKNEPHDLSWKERMSKAHSNALQNFDRAAAKSR